MKLSARAPEHRRWQIKILTATWLAYAGYYFCRMNFYVVKKAFGEALSLDAIGLGHLGTAYLAGYMIGQFSSAYFGRRLGPKRLLLIGTGISIFCNVVFGLSETFWIILVFMAVNGVAQGTGWPALAEELTPRETEVLELMADGLTNKAIAQRLGISDHTVKFHVNAILGKLGAQSRTEAVVRATRLGLLFL